LQRELNGVRAAAKALGDKTVREVTQIKKRVLSAAVRTKISKATKARWAKFRAEQEKVTIVSGESRNPVKMTLDLRGRLLDPARARQ